MWGASGLPKRSDLNDLIKLVGVLLSQVSSGASKRDNDAEMLPAFILLGVVGRDRGSGRLSGSDQQREKSVVCWLLGIRSEIWREDEEENRPSTQNEQRGRSCLASESASNVDAPVPRIQTLAG